MFGNNLHKILQAQKISGKELSQITGISQSTISKFLSGDQEPRYSQIISIANAISVPPDIFMSTSDPHPSINPPMINEFCMVREIYNDELSHLHLTSLYTFKKFTMEVPEICDEALFVVVALEGSNDSKLGTLHAGDYRVIKGIHYKGIKVTFQKGTKNIVIIMNESPGEDFKNWSKDFFDSVERQKKEFLK